MSNLGIAAGTTLLGPAGPALSMRDPARDPFTGRIDPRSLLELRLRFMGERGQPTTFNDTGNFGFKISAVEELPDRVIIFGISCNQPVTLEDELPMFPSDKLIAKIRLLTA